jgi:hypothetical protein
VLLTENVQTFHKYAVPLFATASECKIIYVTVVQNISFEVSVNSFSMVSELACLYFCVTQ